MLFPAARPRVDQGTRAAYIIGVKRFWRHSCSWILAATVTSCASSGEYTWVQDLPSGVTRPAPYAIDEGDLLDIRVYNEPSISGRARVRSDGKVTIALVGDVMARGKTPDVLARKADGKLLLYRGNGRGGFGAVSTVGSGWGKFTAIG